MPVVYHHRREVECPGLEGRVKAVSFEVLLAQSDFLVLTLPLTSETRGLMSAGRFVAMKRGAILINGSRGPVVDEEALLAALDSGHLRAAGLDVFAVEPLPQASPLRAHPRVTALPHIGSATHETRYAMAELATSNLLQELAGERSDCRVP
jgi:gluconate 2-dehydrogenase